MRWEGLFLDLEIQLGAAADDVLDAEVAERTRREFAATSFEGRLRAASGQVVELTVTGLGMITGGMRRVGPGWLLLDVDGGLPAVIATRFVTSARDLPISAREEPRDDGSPAELGVLHVLRVLMRDRTATAVVLADGSMCAGTVDRVGTDYFDLAEHPLDEPRRAAAVRATRSLAVGAVSVLRPRLE